MKEIGLYNLHQTGVIVINDTGIPYFTITGGSTSVRSNAVGYFVPISNDPPSDQPELNWVPRLRSITEDLDHLTPIAAQQINELLLEVSSTDQYRVDENKLDLSHEAWIHIKVVATGDYSQFSGFDEFDAVLTWPNSA